MVSQLLALVCDNGSQNCTEKAGWPEQFGRQELERHKAWIGSKEAGEDKLERRDPCWEQSTRGAVIVSKRFSCLVQ